MSAQAVPFKAAGPTESVGSQGPAKWLAGALVAFVDRVGPEEAAALRRALDTPAGTPQRSPES